MEPPNYHGGKEAHNCKACYLVSVKLSKLKIKKKTLYETLNSGSQLRVTEKDKWHHIISLLKCDRRDRAIRF